jgi:hypothetical protein
MRRPSRRWLIALTLVCGGAVQGAEETAFRYRAPVVVEKPGAFVLVPLSAGVYARSLQADLTDLRVVDARGERVPFTLLSSRGGQVTTTDQVRDASIYPLPPKPAADGTWSAPIELTVQGDRIDVKRRSGARSDSASGLRSGGWVVDLRERKPADPRPRAVRFEWSGPAEFTAAFEFETSDDLRHWQPGGAGQLMALVSPSGTLTQPSVVLPPSAGRFVRLVWTDAATAPSITRAQGLSPEQQTIALDLPAELSFAPGPTPADKQATIDAEAGSLYFDLGGALPIAQIELRWADGTHIAPVRVEGRMRAGVPWWPLAAGVFYRLDRNGVISTSGPLAVGATARYVRVVPDPRAGALDPARTRLVVWAQLPSLLFAAQGQAPYSLLAGSATATAGSLPAGTLVPSLDDERPRFGRAALGAWSEVAAAAREAEAAHRRTLIRLGLLWTVLVGGVAGLAFMVWRLARPTAATGR